jgi:hypothetical protein
MKYILYLILIFLIVSWFVPIIPVKRTVSTGVACDLPPCSEGRETVIKFVTLKEIINHY